MYYQVQFILHQTAIVEISNHHLRNDIVVMEVKANSTFAATVEEDEFSVDGKMYDVLKRTEANGMIYVYCLPDHNETILNQVFNNKVDEQSPLTSGVKNLIKMLVQDGLPIQETSKTEYFKPVTYILITNLNIQNINKDLFLPPPLFI